MLGSPYELQEIGDAACGLAGTYTWIQLRTPSRGWLTRLTLAFGSGDGTLYVVNKDLSTADRQDPNIFRKYLVCPPITSISGFAAMFNSPGWPFKCRDTLAASPWDRLYLVVANGTDNDTISGAGAVLAFSPNG